MISVCMGMLVSALTTAAVIVTACSERRKTWTVEDVEGENLELERVDFWMGAGGLECRWRRWSFQ